MDYREAIEKALKGDEEGFRFLYEETYKSKYYLALQYMKNNEAAEDVLQDAYMKAFAKLHTLDEPEVFAGWLGTIVANTAKNALVKKNPLLKGRRLRQVCYVFYNKIYYSHISSILKVIKL